MAAPLPPVLHGPISPASPSVQTTAIVAGAQVDVFIDGNHLIGTAVAGENGALWVPLNQQPVAGHPITATQTTADGTSARAIELTVIAVPSPLPAPAFTSLLSNAMSAVQLGGLVPGARVTLSQNGAILGQAIATATDQWIEIAPGQNVMSNDPISAQQDLDGALSPVVDSQRVVDVGDDVPPAPGIAAPLAACETTLTVTSATPTADLVVDNEGTISRWFNVATAYAAWGAPPLREGKIVAHQSFPRFNRTGSDVEVPVGPPTAPPQPSIQTDICPELRLVRISNLAPGGTVTLATVAPTPGNPGAFTITEIGTAGIRSSTETFTLPPGVEPTTPAGQPVKLVAQQRRCGLTGPQSAEAGFAQSSSPVSSIVIAGPIYACTRVIVIQSAHKGAQIVATSANTGAELGDPVLVGADPTVVYRLWLPAAHPDEIRITQSGCHADKQAADPVIALPHPLPQPTIAGPVRPQAASVYASGFCRGAMAHLFVNGKHRVVQETNYSDAWIAMPPPALADDDQLTIVQTLCAAASSRDQHPTVVRRGQLAVTLAHPTVIRGTTVAQVVTATDADTGAPVVGAQVRLNNAVVGATGSPFPFSPIAGQPNPAGVVKAVGYFDKAFAIALEDPPPATGQLYLNLGADVLIYDRLRLKTATWTVTPQWNPAQKVTATGSAVTVTLVRPAAATGKLTIELAATWEAAGDIGGYVFNYQSFPGHLLPNPTVIDWDGANRTVGWLTTYRLHPDGAGNAVLIVTHTYMGVQ